jgi:hypothetical protein
VSPKRYNPLFITQHHVSEAHGKGPVDRPCNVTAYVIVYLMTLSQPHMLQLRDRDNC